MTVRCSSVVWGHDKVIRFLLDVQGCYMAIRYGGLLFEGHDAIVTLLLGNGAL